MNGKIFYIIGKSSTGKDTILRKILQNDQLNLKEIVQYTTRPIRDGETEGVEYHFISENQLNDLEKAGKIIEKRTYHTMHGDWHYLMVDDGETDLNRHHYAAVGTIESYTRVRDYYSDEKVIPIYLDVETGERLTRALVREKQNEHPKYTEMCRRFIADENDFSDDALKKAGLMNAAGQVKNRIENRDFNQCLIEVEELIRRVE